MPRRLFGTAGIRGAYLGKVSPHLAYRLGLAVAAYTGFRGRGVVGHDARLTSPILSRMVAAGLMAGGLDAMYIGLVPTPLTAYAARSLGANAGVMVTASHNPPEDNGFKVFQSTGMEYTEEMEKGVEKLLDRWEELQVEWSRVGRFMEALEVGENYVDDLVSRLQPPAPRHRVRIAVDCANGAASRYTPRVVRMLGASVASFNCHEDGYFPGRYPEPRPDVVEPLLQLAERDGSLLLLAHDGDADRLAVAEPGRGFVKQDRLIALYAELKLSEKKGSIIVSVDVGRAVEEVVERMGGRIVRAKLGKTHERLLDTGDALLAAEPWKLIDPEWGLWVDGIYQAALLASLLVSSGKRLSEIMAGIPDYPSARISFRVGSDEEKERLFRRVSERMAEEMRPYTDESRLDGLRLEYDDGAWILFRMSGTEPKLRLYAEAPTQQRLRSLLEKAEGILLGEASKLGISLRR